MPGTNSASSYICARCLRRQSKLPGRSGRHGISYRTFSSTLPPREQQSAAQEVKDDGQEEDGSVADTTGAMSRRLADMTDETLESNGRTARKAVEEAGFSEELQKRLEAKIQDSIFRSDNITAFAQIDMPVSSTIFPSSHPS